MPTATRSWRSNLFWRKKGYLTQVVRLKRRILRTRYSKFYYSEHFLIFFEGAVGVYIAKRAKLLGGINLRTFGKIEWHQRRHDAHHPFSIKRTSWPWFSAELVRIRPTELGYRVKADAAYLAL